MEENCGLEVLVVTRRENKGNRDPRNIVRLEADEQEGCAKRGHLQPPFSADISPPTMLGLTPTLCWDCSIQPFLLTFTFFIFVLQLGLVKMTDGKEDPAVFTTTCLPSDQRLLATVTNAYLGTRVYRDILHVNGVYNGAVGDTHRADVPSPLNVRMTVPGADSLAETFTLNARTGKEQSTQKVSLSCNFPTCSMCALCSSSPTAGHPLLEVKPPCLFQELTSFLSLLSTHPWG